MKTKILTAALTTMMTIVGLTAIAQEDKKAKEARKDAAEAQKDLKEARTDSAADYQAFKKDAELKISDNKKKIAALKAKKAGDNKETNEKYNKKVAALEVKNTELKDKIDRCNDTKTSMWTSFKKEFNHDMEELGKAFKDISVNNEK